MKTLIRNRKYLSGKTPVCSMEIKELPTDIFEEVMKLIVEKTSCEVQFVDDTNVDIHYPYKFEQCKMTNVHLTRRVSDTGPCAFCGLFGE